MVRGIIPGRGIPAGCVAPPSDIPDILGRRALPSGRRAPGLTPRSTRPGHKMSVKRIVPDIKSKHLDASRQFYVDVLGLEVAMDMGFIVTLVSPSNPTAQVSPMRDDDSSTILP